MIKKSQREGYVKIYTSIKITLHKIIFFMRTKIYSLAVLIAFCLFCSNCIAQNKPYTASFIGRMGVDTVLVETYSMINNHLYGKAFIRVPEDYISEFSIHFYPDGSIREFNIVAMDPFNSSVPFKAASGSFEYRLNMNCINDTCTFYNSQKNFAAERIYKHPAKKMDFVGGWVPLICLMEWNCIRLIKSQQQQMPLKMINHTIGVYDIAVRLQNKDTVIFGGPFLEYTKIKTDSAGRILNTNGIGTPWNYYVTKHEPIDIDHLAKRMAKTSGIGIPSPTDSVQAVVQNSKIKIRYGRPFKRGRTIFGSVVPYDSVWRTGANRPTVITLENNIRIGKTIIPKGQYSIYTVPRLNNWLLIFNTDVRRWPTDPDISKDFATVVIPIKKTENTMEKFTIEIEETKKGGLLKFQWENVMAFTEFEVLKN